MHSPHHKSALTRVLADESGTLAVGDALARGLEPGTVMYLEGPLGAGKTTLARGLLRGLGYIGRVKSPTFTLVEVYKFSKLYLYHFDFYRFNDPHELSDAGFRDYFRPDSVCVIEWPQHAPELPPPDIRIVLQVSGYGRTLEIETYTENGRLCLEPLQRT